MEDKKPTITDKLKGAVSTIFGMRKMESDSVGVKFTTQREALGKIFTLMVELEEERKLRDEIGEKYNQLHQMRLNKRNQEIIKALTGRKVKPKKEARKVIKEVEKKAPPPEKPPAPAAAPKPAPKPEAPKPEAPKPTPKAEPVPAPKPPPKVEAPTPPAPVPPTPVAKPSILPTVVKAVTTAAGVFASSDAFAKTMYPYAKDASKKLGGKVPPEAILGQWAGESGNGKSVSAPFNYAGIKAGPGDKKGDFVLTEERYTAEQLKRAQQKGESLERVLGPNDKIKKKGREVTIDEWYGKGAYEKAKAEGKEWVQVKTYFAKYDNFEEFTNAYVKFLSSDRYRLARESTTSQSFGLEVAKAGYATASAQKYSDHISAYVNQNANLIDQLSKENKDYKDKMSEVQLASVTNQVTNISQSTTTMSPAQTQKFDDRPAILRKG